MSDTGSWWCQSCKRPVDGAQVTFEERHEACGAVVEWVEDAVTLQAERDEAIKKFNKLESALASCIAALEHGAQLPAQRMAEIKALLSPPKTTNV